MDLIAPLASGIAGAASGTAEIYSYGTSTASTVVYSDYAGATGVTTHTLDANGAVVRYVNEVVDIIVKDSTGATVRTFTWGTGAKNVEVRNAGFTGTNTNGVQAAGYRTVLDTVLSSFYASFGGLDGKVRVNGTDQLLQTVLAGTTTVFYNVQSTAYGAVGNDSNDDTTAIQNAINAAVNGGGGIVYFPPGTYKINGTLSVGSAKVMLMGSTTDACVIKQYSTTGNWLSITAGNVVVQRLAFTASNATHTGIPINVTTGADHRIEDCDFTGNTNYAIQSAATRFTVRGCRFTLSQTGSRLLNASSASGYVVFNGNIVQISAVLSAAAIAHSGKIDIAGNEFSSSAASGTIEMGLAVGAVFTGNVFHQSGAGTTRLISSMPSTYDALTVAGNALYEEAGSITFLTGTGGVGCNLIDRDQRRSTTSGSATSFQPDTSKYGICEISSSGASMAFTNPAHSYPGARLVLYYKNASGGGITPTFGTAYKIGTAPLVAAGQAATWNFVYNSIASAWVQVGGNSVSFAT